MTPRIIHVASGREWRGGQRQVWLLARELGRLGVAGQVVVTGAGTELARRLTADGVRVHPAPWRLGLDPRVVAAIRRELHAGAGAAADGAESGAPALLHAHDAHALTLAGVARIGTSAPLVVTRRVTFPLRRRGFWTKADRVIAISGAVRDALAASGVSPERMTVIPSGVDLSTEPAEPFDPRAQLGLAPGTPLAINIAALTHEKDHATLLQAAARARTAAPALHWVLIGDGPLRPAIEARIRRLDLARHVSLVGAVAEPERWLGEASALVLSSTSEGFGSVVLAAWARRVPVVATRVGGLAELLDGGGGMLVEPGDSDALSAAVARVVSEPALHETLASRGHAEVRRYSARGMAEQVLAVYRSGMLRLRLS